MKERTYWNEEFKGKARGGYFIRDKLAEIIKEFEKKGFNVVGIKIKDSLNIELICEEKE